MAVIVTAPERLARRRMLAWRTCDLVTLRLRMDREKEPSQPNITWPGVTNAAVRGMTVIHL
eukprot:CAMPEP_0170189766 /NCGR_PEP_ID=MMETSP0040_2-20121228/47632_1 /TAXON_ID=641309 /ORGANISM="Lotharella oceanica, Strain CCMP622" /LENGTH=60 /DNA_ID=CAMNT_0010437423 /DNA_START=470 /DNA_END=652 /DNA_ORIENTATION=-